MPDRYLTREGDLILCGTHGALFRPDDGLCVGGPCAGKSLTPWPVRVEEALWWRSRPRPRRFAPRRMASCRAQANCTRSGRESMVRAPEVAGSRGAG